MCTMNTENINEWDRYFVTEALFHTLKILLTRNDIVSPNSTCVLRQFEVLSPSQVKVCIIGHSPYPDSHHATGIAFESKASRLPASLKNIYTELQNDLGVTRTTGLLHDWIEQGVWLFNPILTVGRKGPQAHEDLWLSTTKIGMREFSEINRDQVVFVALGRLAETLISPKAKYVVVTSHPSPLSAHKGFFGSKIFSKINHLLNQIGHKPIQFGSR